MKTLARLLLAILVLVPAGFAAVLAFGTSPRPPELKEFSSPFKSVDFSDMPALRKLEVAKGSPLAFRVYGSGEKGILVALHGSSAQGASLHPLAKVFAARGYAVYVPDIRGHGASAPRGDADYIFQPDDDLLALIAQARSEHPGKPVNLAGLSLGGGFALAFAGRHPEVSLRRVMLLAPALGSRAPTSRPVQGWASVNRPRVIALHILDRFGIHAFDHLEAIHFAVPPNSERTQVGTYSHALLASLLPLDWKVPLHTSRAPLDIVFGGKDELFDASRADEVAAEANGRAQVAILPEATHISLSLDPAALAQLGDLLDKDRP